MKRYAIRLFYDGRSFHGFQKQKSAPTVEQTLINALRRSSVISGAEKAALRAASRTDAGVSALDQVVSFYAEEEPKPSRINAYLPPEVSAWAYAEVSRSFDPRRSAVWREYICVYPLWGLNLEAMESAAKLFEGVNNLVAFARTRRDELMHELMEVEVSKLNGLAMIRARSRFFLWEMARRVFNAIILVGRGRLELEKLKAMLEPGYRGEKIGPIDASLVLLAKVCLGELDSAFLVDRAGLFRIHSYCEKRVARDLASYALWSFSYFLTPASSAIS